MAYDVPGAGYFVKCGEVLHTESELSGTSFSITRDGEWKRRKKKRKWRECNIYYNVFILGTMLDTL